ncbi:MAG: VCBS repeat-containing protein, partial [Planctomycetes bacterium]|nr:VCBS repeat-containing protein [Planctomycetota bacterium]
RVASEVVGGIPAPAGSYRLVVLADVEGDGDLDIIAASTVGVLVFQNTGGAQFTLMATLPDRDIVRLQAVDLDGDGLPDLIAARADQTTGRPLPMRCWRNSATGFVDVTATAVEAADSSPMSVHAFDSDGNGTIDLWGGADRRQFLWHNDGTGRLLQLSELEYGASPTVCSVLADIDGDGWPDLATIDSSSNQGTEVAIVRNAGGWLGMQRTVLLPTQPNRQPRNLTFVDFDRDGDPDLHVGMRAASGPAPSSQDLMFRNDRGVFTDMTAQSLPVDVGEDTVTAAGDLDGDGAPDLLIGQDGGLHLWRGNGAGAFVDMTGLLPPVTQQVTCLAMIDFDGDGDLDIAWSSRFQPMHLLRNNWPSFTDVAAAVLPAVPAVPAIVTCDFDRDGRPDLVLGSDTGALRTWRNAGGTFVDESSSRLAAGVRPASTIHVADLDDDGWPDLLLVWGTYDWPQQLHNKGGVFEPLAAGVLPPDSEPRNGAGAGVADLDGDGDSDLVAPYGVLHNLARQLGNSVPPRIGRYGELLLQAYGGNGVDPQACVLLLASAAANPPVPIRSLGLLRLDPTSTWLHSVRVLPGIGGAANIRYLVPPRPALLGAHLMAQGLFLHTSDPAGWRFGNAVRIAVRL